MTINNQKTTKVTFAPFFKDGFNKELMSVQLS